MNSGYKTKGTWNLVKTETVKISPSGATHSISSQAYGVR
jgi:hypothetical protein